MKRGLETCKKCGEEELVDVLWHGLCERCVGEEIRAGRIVPCDVSHRNERLGTVSNSIIRRRNGGVRHQFEDNIGGCSSNYR